MITSEERKQNKFIDILVDLLVDFEWFDFGILEDVVNRLPGLRLKIVW